MKNIFTLTTLVHIISFIIGFSLYNFIDKAFSISSKISKFLNKNLKLFLCYMIILFLLAIIDDNFSLSSYYDGSIIYFIFSISFSFLINTSTYLKYNK